MSPRDPEMEPIDTAVGRLVNGLQSLELLLRVFLHNNRPAGEPKADMAALERALPGDTVPVNAFTDYRTLGELIAAFNDSVPKSAPNVDATVVALRDALAHGRVYAKQAGPPLHLMKFGKPASGRVPVEFNQPLTLAWLEGRQRFVNEQLDNVYRALGAA